MEAHFPISGSHGDIGRRPTMEDRHLVLDDAGQTYGDILKDKRYAYYGVYDGHGGRDAADYCAKLFHTNLFNDPAFQEGRIEEALRNAFLNTDKQILEAAKTENFASGSTVVIGIIDLKDNIFYVANVGDSEAVVSKRNEAEGKYEPIVLTTKHKPSDQSEKDRIKKAGGHVVFGRVMGTLAVARAIGDRDFKHPFCKGEADFVSPEPAITKFQLTSDNDFIIISCDGLWEKLSYEQAMQFTGKLKDSGKNPQETTEVLVKEAIDKGSLDNVTAIVVYLSSPRPMKEMKSEKEEKEEKLENCDRDSDPELMTVWEFLRTGGEQKPNQDDVKLLKYFNLPPEEQLALQFPCALEKKLLYQGIMLLTQNYLCFYSTLFGKKILEQININDIETIEKQKSLLVANAIKITTKDGKKLFFNWKQNAGARDQVFSKLLDIIAKLDDTSPRPSVSRKDEKPEKQPEKQPEKTEKVEKTEKTEKEKTEKPKKTEEKEPEKLDKSRKPEEPQPEKVPERKTENPLYIYRERGVTKQPPKIRPSPESPSTSEPGSRRESEADKSEKRSEGSDSPKENRNS